MTSQCVVLRQWCFWFLTWSVSSTWSFYVPSRHKVCRSSTCRRRRRRRLFDSSSKRENEATNSGTQQPTISFADLGLCPPLFNAARSNNNWNHPTNVQRLVIPELLQNPPFVCVSAPTGSGKTAAFLLPLLQQLQQQPTSPGKIQSLILVPTRELAIQIESVLHTLVLHTASSKTRPWRTLSIHGGVPRATQIAALADGIRNRQGMDVVVATPGRLVDVIEYYAHNEDDLAQDEALERRVLDAMQDKNDLNIGDIEALQLDRQDDDGRLELANILDGLEYLILDEADRLLSRTFESEVDNVLNLIRCNQVRTWLFSATFPKAIEPRVDAVFKRLSDNDTEPPLRISCTNSDRISDEPVSASLSKKLQHTQSTKNIASIDPASTIDLRTICLEKRDRTQALRYLLNQNPTWDRVLVFVGTRYSSEHVSRKLRRVGIRAAELHGKLDQDARERRLNHLRNGTTRVLLTTDVCARGLDISNLPVVVNYDLPRSTTDFVHRVGRTGRAGRAGTAVTFCTADSQTHLDLIETRHLTERPEREILPGFEIDQENWNIQVEGSRVVVPGSKPSDKGLAHDRMYGGIKGRRKSKKDRLREQAARDTTSNEQN